MHYVLRDDFSIKQISIKRSVAVFVVDQDDLKHPRARVHSTRKLAEEQARKFLAAQVQQMAQLVARHERRKNNVANY